MGLLFEKTIDAFSVDPALKIENRSLQLSNLNFLDRVDLTFRSVGDSYKAEYPYIHDLSVLKQLLPVPAFLLRPLEKYRLPYEHAESNTIKFDGQRTVIYIHGSGSVSEDNSILQRLLLQNNCDLIRISYHIDYEKESISFPKKAADMFSFLTETEAKIAPAINNELKCVLTKLIDEFEDLFLNKEVILIGHSLGGGLAANIIATYDSITFKKFINLDGTLMSPAIQSGLNIRQLHLSQDHLFKKEWIAEENFTDSINAIGQDYCKKIDNLIRNSENRRIWIQIKDSSHFTFTDFPDLLRPYKMFRGFVGNRESAARIRKYVMNFILDPEELRIDSKDNIIIDC